MGKRKKSATTKAQTGSASHSLSNLHQNASVTLREESSGKKQNNVSAKSMLKLEHIKNLAVWASGEGSMPSLAAFFGNRLAASAEALSVPPDANLFSCQRCESVLQPGYNCTVRIEKKKTKVRHKLKKSSLAPKNSVVYTCQFCSHRNVKRGTPKNYIKEICTPRAKSGPKVDPVGMVAKKVPKLEVLTESKDSSEIIELFSSQQLGREEPRVNSPSTPNTRQGNTLLDLRSNKRSRNKSRKVVVSGSSSAPLDAEAASNAPSKRKRKSWTSLKDIAKCSEQDGTRSFANLKIPFIM